MKVTILDGLSWTKGSAFPFHPFSAHAFVAFFLVGNQDLCSLSNWREDLTEIAYLSRSHIERKMGPIRYAQLPGEAKPVIFSVHGAVAKHYGVKAEDFGESHATTIDYLVASVAG